MSCLVPLLMGLVQVSAKQVTQIQEFQLNDLLSLTAWQLDTSGLLFL